MGREGIQQRSRLKTWSWEGDSNLAVWVCVSLVNVLCAVLEGKGHSKEANQKQGWLLEHLLMLLKASASENQEQEASGGRNRETGRWT